MRIFLRWVQQGIERRIKGFKKFVQEDTVTFIGTTVGMFGLVSLNLWIIFGSSKDNGIFNPTLSWIFGLTALGCLLTILTLIFIVVMKAAYEDWKVEHPEELRKRKGKLIGGYR